MKGRGSLILLLLGLAIVLLSCAFFEEIITLYPTRVPAVVIENHPRPEFTLDLSSFEDVGCPPDEYGLRYCEEDSPITALGCDRIGKPSDLLGGLEPSLPIAVCLLEPLTHPDEPELLDMLLEAEDEYLYSSGGLMPVFVRYVIIQDDQFRLIKSEEQFRELFAPIETSDEALSYALALKNLSAYYDLEPNPEYEYFVDELEDTHVQSSTDGYLVHLYSYRMFGCGPHLTYAVDLRVTDQGNIEEINRVSVYKDPSEDDLCVD